MSYNFPASGGLRLTHNGKTVGVFMNQTPLGPILLVGEYIDGTWLGRWTHGPYTEESWKGSVQSAGGNVAYLKTLLDKITAAVKTIFGSSAHIPKNFIDEINFALAEHFQITLEGVTARD